MALLSFPLILSISLQHVFADTRLSRFICEKIRRRTNKLKDAYSLLKAMSRYSNKTETKTYMSVTKTEGRDDDIDMDDVKALMAGVKIPSPCKDEQTLQNATSSEPVEPWWPSGESCSQMAEFAKFYNHLITRKNTCLIEPLKMNDSRETKEEYGKKINETCRLIREWSENKNIPDDKRVFFPTEYAGEKDGVQPILYALLWALTTMGTRKGEDIHRERVYPPLHDQAPRRLVDFEAGEPRPYSKVALPITATQVPIENTARKRQNPENVHMEGRKQNIGHSGKRVLVAFDIGNTGVDASSTSILKTPTYVEAVKVSLTDTGTDDVRVETHFSKMFPLVSHTAFEKLVHDEKNKEFLAKQLFPGNCAEPNDVPSGLEHLRDLIRASERDLGGINLNSGDVAAKYQEFDSNTLDRFVDKNGIKELIGTGAHGHVYSYSTENEGGCVKASRGGETYHIEREVVALQRFAMDSAKPDQIPRLWSMGRVEYSSRNSVINVPAFCFGPKGVPVTAIMKNGSDSITKATDATNLWNDISAALSYCHEKEIIHCDVPVENFLWDSSKGVFVLGDWSCSAAVSTSTTSKKKVTRVKGFRGALAFASAKVHALSFNKHWVAKPEFDFASLGFSVAAFIVGESVPWHGFYERIKNRGDPRFAERRRIARQIIEKTSITEGTKASIVDSFDGAEAQNKH